jgi:hypothetical protein
MTLPWGHLDAHSAGAIACVSPRRAWRAWPGEQVWARHHGTMVTCWATRRRPSQIKVVLGKQRGSKVARVELARELSSAIWYMLTRQEPFRAVGPTRGLVA